MIAQGPVASQEIIKELGTNGGGFFNANAAHPYENPTPLTGFVLMLAMLAIPFAFTYLFGRFAGNQRQGWALFAAAAALLVLSVGVMYASEQAGNPNLTRAGADQTASATQAGGNMEGKEVRNGIGASVLWATITTDTSTGAVNASSTTASRRSPAGWRCSTSPSARWCSAAPASVSWGCWCSPSWRCSSPA